MAKKDNYLGLLTKEESQACIQKIISFIQKENDENIGIIAAEEYLDFFLDEIAGHIYNKGLRDAKRTLENTFENLNIDIDSLEK